MDILAVSDHATFGYFVNDVVDRLVKIGFAHEYGFIRLQM